MTNDSNGGTLPQISLDWPGFVRELAFSFLISSLMGAVTVLMTGMSEWRGIMLTSNLNALFGLSGIALGLHWLRPTVRKAASLFLLIPMAGSVLGCMVGLSLSSAPLSFASSLWLTGISMALNLALGLLLYSRAHSRSVTAAWQAEQLRNAEQRQQLLSAELKMLQAQIEPHFLFNTLANLRSLIVIDPPAALTMFDHINEYLRATLARTRNDNGSVASEFALLQHYLAIMQLRLGERLAFQIDCPDEVARLPLPPLLVQPLVENAIRHGIEPSINGGAVTLSARRVGERLRIQVADSGSGIGTRQNGDVGNVGLNNIRQRLQALYGDAATLQLTNNRPHGTIAVLALPLLP